VQQSKFRTTQKFGFKLLFPISTSVFVYDYYFTATALYQHLEATAHALLETWHVTPPGCSCLVSEDNGNKKLAYSGQRLEGMVDRIESQGPQWTIVLEK